MAASNIDELAFSFGRKASRNRKVPNKTSKIPSPKQMRIASLRIMV
jgi:hypothetical protein